MILLVISIDEIPRTVPVRNDAACFPDFPALLSAAAAGSELLTQAE
ncbi:MAG: hypothetical protein OXH27_09320 [Gammaproteobacteria bacterium]|nr:hypothetical protein [Gammaproteobacteria bacterium]MCY3690339.1 hypothetical protein [Gammaproteobacteria bacterium]MDE0479924.1 hypothetical protein [Gammaproteobacteria bacterium]